MLLRAIVLKEWLKIRWIWLVTLLINLGVLIYLFADMRHQFQVEHSEMIWYWAFELRRLLYTTIKYLPAVSGALIAAAQFTPEMIGGRFRLSLHLPVHGHFIVWSWVGFGAVMSGLLALLVAFGLYAIVLIWFPHEAAVSAVLTSLPWLLGGWVTYFGVTLVLLEPQPMRRVVYLGLSLAYLALLYLEKGYQEYDHAILTLMVIALLFIPAVILPAHRYRHRS
jgi:hypothetical protein